MVASLINYAFGFRNTEPLNVSGKFQVLSARSRVMNKTFKSYQPVTGVVIHKVILLLLNYLHNWSLIEKMVMRINYVRNEIRKIRTKPLVRKVNVARQSSRPLTILMQTNPHKVTKSV